MKKYHYTINEESCYDPAYRGGRIERWTEGMEYPDEFRFLVPIEAYDAFFTFFDGLETNWPMRIAMDVPYIDSREGARGGYPSG